MKVLLNNMEKVQEFVSIVCKSKCDVDLISGKTTYLDAKSILGILSCNINDALNIEIMGEDEDKEKLVNSISKFITE